LLTDFSRPFFRDFVLPRGTLREPRTGSARADVIVVSKGPSLSEEIRAQHENEIQSYTGSKPIFFSDIVYSKPVSLMGSSIGKEIMLVTGIASSKPLVDHISEKVKIHYHFDFNDHHEYSPKEVEEIERMAAGLNASILTTEKDFVKLEKMVDTKLWFYLPIETQFVNNGSEFDKSVLDKIEGHLSK
jgi:tetraacyldisaccharide 4'-kinase